MRDLASGLHLVRAIAAAAAVADNTPIVSSIVDRAGYEGLMFAISAGALADADATFAVEVHHGDDAALADAAVVPAGQLTGTKAGAGFTFADDNECRKLGYTGSKRYVRLTITPTGNAGNAFVTAVAVLGFGRHGPGPALT